MLAHFEANETSNFLVMSTLLFLGPGAGTAGIIQPSLLFHDDTGTGGAHDKPTMAMDCAAMIGNGLDSAMTKIAEDDESSPTRVPFLLDLMEQKSEVCLPAAGQSISLKKQPTLIRKDACQLLANHLTFFDINIVHG